MSTSTTAPAWADRNRRSRHQDWDLATFTERWLTQIKNPGTRRKYGPYFDLFVTWMTRYSDHRDIGILRDAGVAELEDYFDYLQSPHWEDHPGDCNTECASLPYETPSLKAKYDALSSAYNYAGVHQIRASNPVKAIKLDKRQRKQRTILLPWEIEDVMAKARATSLRSAVANGYAIGCGMRCEEIENVDVAKFYDVPRGRMLSFRRKGGDVVDIDIPHRLARLTDEYLKGRTEGALIVSQGRRTRNPDTGELEHTRLDASGIYRMVQAAGAACGFKIGPHDDRAPTAS
jgi:hypothetical protein